MTHEPRRIAFLGREERVKHYAIGDVAPAFAEATRRAGASGSSR